MKSIYKLKSILAFGAVLAMLASTGIAQDTRTQERDKTQDQQDVQDRNPNRAGDLDPKTLGTNIRASQLTGTNIENSSEESVGKINDIVIDTAEGKVRYIAVTYGGFLGIGNDMHAVPFEAFKFKADPDDPSETVLVLNVTQEQMKGAKGFDEDNWPNFADTTFTSEIDRRYGVDRRGNDKRLRETSDRRIHTGEKRDVESDRASKLDDKTRGPIVRASQLIGMNVENSAEKNVGKINDIVIDAREGDVRYVAVTYGGFLGIGNDMHAVPFEALKCKPDPDDKDETVIVLDVTQEQMRGAKGFNESTWPNFADEDFTREIDKRYGVDRSKTKTDRDSDRNQDDEKEDRDGDDG